MIDPTFWLGLATGLAASAALGLALWWVLGRRLRRPSSSLRALSGGRRPATGDPVSKGLDVSDLRASSPPLDAGLLEPPAPPYPRPEIVEASSWEDGLRTSERLLLHVARQGVVGPEEVAPRALCQAGMIDDLGVSQGALTGVLRRLVSAEVLHVSREHVRGIDRRVKVYRLTPAGERLVRQIRSRGPAATPPPTAARSLAGRDTALPRVQIVPPPERAPANRT